MSSVTPTLAAIDAALAKGEWWIQLFDELSERGARRAEALNVRDSRGLRRVVDDFQRIARGVRLAIVAATRLEGFLRGLAQLCKLSPGGLVAARERANAKAHDEAAAREVAREKALARREARAAEVRERVVEIIEREKPARRERDPLVDALDRRLAVDPALVELDDLPLREIVIQICADLGITPDWRRWEAGGWRTTDPPAGAVLSQTLTAARPKPAPAPAPWESAPPPKVLPPPAVRQGLPGLTARRTDTAISLALGAGTQAPPWRPPKPG